MDAHFVEQRKRAAGRDGWVSSSLVTCLKDKHQKVTRQQGETKRGNSIQPLAKFTLPEFMPMVQCLQDNP